MLCGKLCLVNGHNVSIVFDLGGNDTPSSPTHCGFDSSLGGQMSP